MKHRENLRRICMRVDINFNNHVSELILNAPPVIAINSSEWHELADTIKEI